MSPISLHDVHNLTPRTRLRLFGTGYNSKFLGKSSGLPVGSSLSPPPPVGSPSFGSSPVGSQRPVLLDEMSARLSTRRPSRLPPLFSGDFHGCLANCQRKCRTTHAIGGTNRRRKNRKQKGTRRHGSRRYRR